MKKQTIPTGSPNTTLTQTVVACQQVTIQLTQWGHASEFILATKKADPQTPAVLWLKTASEIATGHA